MKYPSIIRRQAGFTLPEILVVLVLLGILVSTLTISFNTAEQELALTSSKDLLLNDMPSALLSYRARKGSLTGLTKSEITSSGMPSNGPFGDAWSLGTITARSAVINWALNGATNSESFGNNLKDSLVSASSSAITAATYNRSRRTLVVTYRIP